MANRRASIHSFYEPERVIIGGTPAATTRYDYHGEAFEHAIVVRCDLNGYSSWARDKPTATRVDLLSEFFSAVVPLLTQHGGVYFRDEGDCIVALFSAYFRTGATYDGVRMFCQGVVGRRYGQDQLTAKAVVAFGPLAFFQKRHEVATGDWSAEGHPFVAAARLEQAVDSKQRITFFKTDYDNWFRTGVQLVPIGTPTATWLFTEEKLCVEGLGFVRGWTDVAVLEYVG